MEVVIRKFKNEGKDGTKPYLKYVCTICLREFTPQNSKPKDVFIHGVKEHDATSVVIKDELET